MTEPKNLPVYLHKQEILDALKVNQVIIVESPTGSGKTTQIPLILKEAGYADEKTIAITQPRRIAAVSVCSYIQKQLNDEQICGYKMRFYDTTSPSTRIKILTDGMLLQEFKSDPTLSQYKVVMVDEAHERSLNIDFILGLLKDLCSVRKDLKIIISSATINTKTFSVFFKDENKNPAPVISIPTRTYNVDTKYFPLSGNTMDSMEETVSKTCSLINNLVLQKKENPTQSFDTLVFLPGELEIKTCIQALYSECDYSCLQIYPLYGRLNKEEQELVFTPTEKGKIKVVLTTNIAETSLTIDNITVVIDSGLARINYYNQQNFTSSLVTRKISKASVLQRTGRAGRTSEGLCYRLFSKEDFNQRKQFSTQEILRTDLSEVVLRMSDLEIYNPQSFSYITKPDKDALISSIKTLRLIDAIDQNNHLTPTGELMVKFPLLPRHSKALVYCIKEYPQAIMNVIVCISFLSSKTPFLLPIGQEDEARLAHRRFSSQYGDFVSYQYIYKKYSSLISDKDREDFCNSNYLDKQSMDEILHISHQLADIVREIGLPVPQASEHFGREQAHEILVCLSSGLIQYICTRTKGSVYKTLTADEIFIHPGSAWFTKPPQFLLAGEIVMTSKMYARTVSPLEEDWLKEISPGLLSMLKKSSRKQESNERKPSSAKETKKNAVIYNRSFDILYKGNGKKLQPIVIIPSKDLFSLYKAHKKSNRHPKGIKCSVEFANGFICCEEKFSDLMSIATKLDLEVSHIVKKLPQNVWYQDNISELIPHLKTLMKTAPTSKCRQIYGFIELVYSSNGWFLHVNKSWAQALNNSAYSLLCIKEISNDNAFTDAYNRLLRLLN